MLECAAAWKLLKGFVYQVMPCTEATLLLALSSLKVLCERVLLSSFPCHSSKEVRFQDTMNRVVIFSCEEGLIEESCIQTTLNYALKQSLVMVCA